jgi:hypothetical protein
LLDSLPPRVSGRPRPGVGGGGGGGDFGPVTGFGVVPIAQKMLPLTSPTRNTISSTSAPAATRNARNSLAIPSSGLYEGLYAQREDLAEVYRRLAYDLDRFWGLAKTSAPPSE